MRKKRVYSKSAGTKGIPATKGLSEDKIQMHVVKEALRLGIIVHGDQNAARRSMAAAAKAKLMGMRSGWPDLCFILNRRIVWVELKAAKTPVADTQQKLHEAFALMGHECYVVRALNGDDAWEQIKKIIFKS